MSDTSTDVQTVEVLSDDGDLEIMQKLSKELACMLCEKYKHYPWSVAWAPGGVLVVKCLLGDNRYGFTIDASKLSSYSDLSRQAMLAGGELLERMGLSRSQWTGADMGTAYQQ